MKTFLQITPSVFANHRLAPKHPDVLARVADYNFPVFLLLFICCALAMYIYLRYYKKSLQVFSAIINYSASQQIQREGHSFIKSFSICLFLIYAVCGGIFFADLSIYSGWFKSTSLDVVTGLSIMTLLVIILLRRIIGQLFGIMIKEKNAAEDSFFHYAFGIYVGALFLLVFCLMLRYSAAAPSLLFQIAISVLGLLYIIRIVKTLVFGYSVYGFSLFHLVLYLCAVEIIPLAVFVKLIVNS